MNALGYIAAGGVCGALLRYWVTNGIDAVLGRNFPYGTLTVNVLGSFLIGVLSLSLLQRFEMQPELRLALIVGLLGSFTTFSSFSLETLALLQEGAIWRALMNILSSVGLCLAATWIGLLIGRQL